MEDELILEKKREEIRIYENELLELDSFLPKNEWGVKGQWCIPICIKMKNKKIMKNNSGKNKNNGKKDNDNKNDNNKNDKKIDDNNNNTIKNDENSRNDDDNSETLLPIFLNIQTIVMLPQIDSDTKTVDFGQIAIGSRFLKTVLISNLGYNSVNLLSSGINAVGPFSLLNPVKILHTGEFKKIIIECFPLISGLFHEILEFRNSDEIGGHRIRISLHAQGVTPCVALTGLLPMPGCGSGSGSGSGSVGQGGSAGVSGGVGGVGSGSGSGNNQGNSSGSGSGILDFGNVLVDDICTQNFTVSNYSTFAIDVDITRTVCMGLSPYEQLNEVTDRTITGLPVFSYRPESVRLQPGKTIFLPHKNTEIAYFGLY